MVGDNLLSLTAAFSLEHRASETSRIVFGGNYLQWLSEMPSGPDQQRRLWQPTAIVKPSPISNGACLT